MMLNVTGTGIFCIDMVALVRTVHRLGHNGELRGVQVPVLSQGLPWSKPRLQISYYEVAAHFNLCMLITVATDMLNHDAPILVCSS